MNTRSFFRFAVAAALTAAIAAPISAEARALPNRAAAVQDGVNNRALALQTGQGNDAAMVQIGDDNSACLIQNGDRLGAEIGQVGNRNDLGVLQNENSTRLVSYQVCSVHVERMTQRRAVRGQPR